LNMSETGIAFLVEPDSRIRVGEKIKVEIPIPSGDQIAWWGRIVRTQEYEPRDWIFGSDPFKGQKKIMVAVTYDELPDCHTRTIRKGIQDTFMKAMREQQCRNWLYYRTVALQRLWQVLLFTVLIGGVVAFFWYFSRPSENYDPNRGAPWGERFKF